MFLPRVLVGVTPKMTKILCLTCLGKGVIAELNFRKAQQTDPSHYQCPKCGLKIYVDYGEKESGERERYMPLPRPDLETEESFPEETRESLLENYIRRRFKN